MVASMFSGAYEALVSSVVDLRKRAKLTQRQLAASLGREQNYVGRIETRQRRIDLVELAQICLACGVDPEEEIGQILRRIRHLIPRKLNRKP
jgi:transcriptional regulator with XRE-family HTH domain